ncbi:MAG: hypothetical protein KY450_12135, partial [Actinobacteria bacterium]|nr:hypothetical protein [Actinomycetota bacterium]
MATIPNSAFGRTTRPSSKSTDARLTMVELGLELGDALASRPPLCVLAGRGAGQLSTVDPVLADSAVDRGLRNVH